MQSRLEDVLKEKERELKLHERFLNLKRFCEEEVFPFAAVPLQRHVERLKSFVERLIPEPKDRTEELFSGEIFTLLCVLYFHDIGVVSRFAWSANEEILSRIDSSSRTLLLNQEIARRLDIPESAIELVNAIIFSPVVKKIPTEWEIVEGPKKAIVRNARMLEQIVGFAHLLWDIFSVDSGNVSLRRFQNTNLRLRCGETRLAVDGREGLICIRCKPEVSYQYHALEEIKALVEDGFTNFKNHVNGRLGFQYRELSWEIDGDPGPQGNVLPMPQLFPFTTYRDMPFKRWGEASQLLDKLFHFGYVMVVGEANTGKTTLLNFFVIPQLQRISFNVFYAEIWESPVSEVRDAIKKAGKMPEGSAADIVSMAAGLAQKASCFFILDGCERLKFITGAEKEKLERFVDFCLGREDAYIIAVGDKEEFFDWYRPFERMSLSALFETRELEEGSGIAGGIEDGGA